MTLLQGGDHLQDLHHSRDHAQRQDGEGATNGKLGHKQKSHTKDGVLLAEILHQLRLVVYPIIYRVLYIPGGARFQPQHDRVLEVVWVF